ncbi:hypothetical protein QH_0044 [Vibrio phage QH]|uniref:Uncharacterized protein n=2 Tax=Enhodamvirus VP2 TaxID=1922331 RepID=A0A2D0Z3R1_9CAUD|nr:hypothetical protein ACQ41_gp44 [Vibrio phage QH]YP_053002.1 hypothetical protein VP2p43 [Vibrio phage VP2]YP_053040.1 hypothetical protein VP5_gp46 [Vibrio phage VP5]ASV42824.1 hypothetical protein [Vibrio phage JSF15]ASV43043.1 hypothetical protein [Vibrio phage JSF33]ASV43687.1 hypothetical protein [Vibrio phage JSF9]AIZ01395.1 hypothetical protein QH_0044 [Vibrio phage QH]
MDRLVRFTFNSRNHLLVQVTNMGNKNNLGIALWAVDKDLVTMQGKKEEITNTPWRAEYPWLTSQGLSGVETVAVYAVTEGVIEVVHVYALIKDLTQ